MEYWVVSRRIFFVYVCISRNLIWIEIYIGLSHGCQINQWGPTMLCLLSLFRFLLYWIYWGCILICLFLNGCNETLIRKDASTENYFDKFRLQYSYWISEYLHYFFSSYFNSFFSILFSILFWVRFLNQISWVDDLSKLAGTNFMRETKDRTREACIQ